MSRAEPYAGKQTTAFGGLANFILIDEQSKGKRAIILSLPNKKDRHKPVQKECRMGVWREDALPVATSCDKSLVSELPDDFCRTCELHLWLCHKCKSNRPPTTKNPSPKKLGEGFLAWEYKPKPNYYGVNIFSSLS